MPSRTRHPILLLVALTAFLCSACFSAPPTSDGTLEGTREQRDAGPPQAGGTYRYVLPSDARSLDPHAQSAFNTHIAIGATYSKLVEYRTGPDIPYGATELKGDLAESWETSPDGLTWTFRLRPGVRWHDVAPVGGREFTSDDVLCTMDRIRELPGHQASQLDGVTDISAPDAHTVTFQLDRPYAEFDTTMANHFMWILPCEGTRGQFDLATQAIGTGPFILQSWNRDRERILVANPDYYVPEEPYVQRMEVSIVADQAAALAAFRTGASDYLSALNLDQIQAARVMQEMPDSQLFRETGLVQTRLFMNQERTPFDDLRVRRAVALSINRAQMVEAVRSGGDMTGPVTPSLFGGLPSEEAARLQPFDPEQARRLLAEAGFPDGFSTRMIVTDGYGENVVREAQWVQQDLEAVGIRVELEVQDYATYFTESFAGKDYDMGYGLQTPMLSADEYLSGEWKSDGSRNWYGIDDPTLDRMVEEQRGQMDPEIREQQLHEIQRYILENVSNPVPLYVYDGLAIYAPHAHNIYSHPEYGLNHLARMWLGPQAPGRS